MLDESVMLEQGLVRRENGIPDPIEAKKQEETPAAEVIKAYAMEEMTISGSRFDCHV